MSGFSAENIKSHLRKSGSDFELDVVVHDTVDSTNTWALSECKLGRALPFVCFSEEQTAGRGRRGKVWVMPPKSNIAMSLAWPLILPEKNLLLLPLTIALVIAEMLEGFNLKQVQVKWPNDVYVGGVKIAGVLIEAQAQPESLNSKKMAVVIGIGLNYDMGGADISIADDLKLLFTDVCSEIKKQSNKAGRVSEPDRITVASELLKSVMCACQAYHENTESVLKSFRQKYDYCQNKLVDVLLDDQSRVTGLAKGVTDNAELVVEVDGRLQYFNSADVSVNTGD